MCGWFHPNKMHADHANLINEWINECNAIMNFGYTSGHSSHLPWLNYGSKSSVYRGDLKFYKTSHLKKISFKKTKEKGVFRIDSWVYFLRKRKV